MKFNSPEFKQLTKNKKRIRKIIYNAFKVNHPNDGDVMIDANEILDKLYKEFDITEKPIDKKYNIDTMIAGQYDPHEMIKT